MFRRKEEGDAASPESSNQISMPVNAPVQDAQSTSASQSSAGSAPMNSYAPSTPSQPQQQAARPAAATTSGYRPAAPLSEFSRNPARSEAPVRSSSAPSQSSGNTGSAPAFSAFSDKSGQKTNRRVLTVGNDILLKGEIATCDRLVIEGRVEAKLSEVHTVEIAECGSFKGTAEVEDAEISGVFEGDLIVRNRLVIYSSGEVRGNISYGEIEIERGGRLTGQIKTVAVNGTVQTQQMPGSRPTAQEVKARAAAKEFAA